jgi:hypothetical protein
MRCTNYLHTYLRGNEIHPKKKVSSGILSSFLAGYIFKVESGILSYMIHPKKKVSFGILSSPKKKVSSGILSSVVGRVAFEKL